MPELIEAADAGAGAGGAGRDDRRRRGPGATSGSTPTTCASASPRPRPTTPPASLRAFYGLYAEARGKPRWGDKTPGYVKRMRPIGGVLAEARFVHLIRDGRDVALSRRKRGMGEGKPIGRDRRALAAADRARAASRPKRLRGRYLELRYEDLVADPEPALRRVCELIELDYDPAMLAYHEGAGERLAELGDLAPRRRAAPGGRAPSGRRRTRSPPARRPRDRVGAWRDGDERRRPARVRGGRRRPARRARLRRGYPERPHMALDYSIKYLRNKRLRPRSEPAARRRSWSASVARARPCCG